MSHINFLLFDARVFLEIVGATGAPGSPSSIPLEFDYGYFNFCTRISI